MLIGTHGETHTEELLGSLEPHTHNMWPTYSLVKSSRIKQSTKYQDPNSSFWG